MELIPILGSSQAVLFLFIILRKKNKVLCDKILAAFFLICAMHLLIRYLFSTGLLIDYPHLLGTHAGFPLLYGPLLYFYVHSLTKKKQKFESSYWFHFIPFLIVMISLIPFFMQPVETKLNIINGKASIPQHYYFVIIMQILSGPNYIYWVWSLLKKHKENVGQFFSNIEKVELKWLKNIAVGLAGVWFVIVVVYTIWWIISFNTPFEKEGIIYAATTVFIFVIGYKGLTQTPFILPDLITVSGTKERIQSPEVQKSKPPLNKNRPNSNESDLEVEKNIKNLLQYMEEKKPYLESNLTLAHVSAATNIPHYKLTRIFNEHLNQNFFIFVNSYRIENVKTMLLDPENDHLTILALAYDSGFSSKSSFNRIFKQLTDLTPSEYQKSIRK